jgi:hypothetical protein
MPGYQQYNLAALLALFYEQVGNNTVFFRTDEATRILQEAFRVFNCLTGFWRGQVTMPNTVANNHWYATPAGLTYVLRVEILQTPLVTSSLQDLDYGEPLWENETCVSGQLPYCFANAGVNQFAIWPASFAGGEPMVVEGVIPAPVLAGLVGNVNLGQDELEMILNYAGHIAQFKEGGQEFQASELVFQEFLKQAGQRNSMLMQSSKFRTWMGLANEKRRPMQLPAVERVGAR